MQIKELQQWISNNLFNKNGKLDSNKLKNKGNWIYKNNSEIYYEIFSKTDFLYSEYTKIYLTQRIWHIWNNIFKIVRCKYCNNITIFYGFQKGYSNYCSTKCSGIATIEKAKQTKEEKYGDPRYNNRYKEQTTKEKKYGDPKYNNIEQMFQTKEERYGNPTYNNAKKAEQTKDERYGDQKYNNQYQALKTKEEKYGSPKYNNIEQMFQTKEERYGNPTYNNVEKIKQTKWENFGDQTYNNRYQAWKTTKERFGVSCAMQDPKIAEKSFKSRFKFKDYQLPSGKWIKVQGYEHFAINELLKKYNEHEIFNKPLDMPKIWYIGEDYRHHRYFPDFYIPKNNLIIEVKSIYTYKYDENVNILKKQATEQLGYNFNFLIFESTGKIKEL